MGQGKGNNVWKFLQEKLYVVNAEPCDAHKQMFREAAVFMWF